ncbi:apolipoprotein A-IV-like [Pleurodeles waltl]|uniref:apolipoprotein A-IV-like n=1 Tax=Pleurodeles waltl TaxID=8319 RepID=UPI0037094ED0
MFLKSIGVVLAFLAITGSCTNVGTDEIEDGFWGYLNELRSSTQEAAQQIQESQISKQFNTLLQENLQDVPLYAAQLQSQLVPLTTHLHAKLSQDSEKLKEQIRRELEELRLKVSPYADDIHKQLNKNIEELQLKLAPYAVELASRL